MANNVSIGSVSTEQVEAGRSRRLMCVLAHPDDETLGMGGMLAKYAAEGVTTAVLTATRGEYGWSGDADANPGPEALGAIRAAELRAATAALGVDDVTFLDYQDGQLDQADAAEVTAKIAAEIRRFRPDVVVTFGHDGLYGHPDHIAICQFATAAIVAAADPSFATGGDAAAHRVSKLYYRAAKTDWISSYEAAFGELVMEIDGRERRSPGWADWTITTRVDASEHWEQVWEAVQCHRSQLPLYEGLKRLPAERHAELWGTQEYYRVFSAVNGGRELETDLFAGLPARVVSRTPKCR